MPALHLDSSKTPRPWVFRDLPVFPGVALELIQLLQEPDTSTGAIVGLLEKDPGLCAEILRVANSARFQRKRRVREVRRAVAAIGIKNTMKVAVQSALRGLVGGSLQRRELERCWEHCLRTATLAEALAASCNQGQRDAYLAGLLHDIGRLAMLAMYPDEYARLLNVAGETNSELLASEEALFDIDHCRAGAWVAERWELPAELAEVALRHHDKPTEGGTLLSLIAIAQSLSSAAESAGEDREALIDELRSRLDEGPLTDIDEALCAVVSALGRPGVQPGGEDR